MYSTEENYAKAKRICGFPGPRQPGPAPEPDTPRADSRRPRKSTQVLTAGIADCHQLFHTSIVSLIIGVITAYTSYQASSLEAPDRIESKSD